MKKYQYRTPLSVQLLLLTICAISFSVSAEPGGDIRLAKDKPFIYVTHEGRSVKIERVQDPDHELTGYYAKTARKCPPFCFQPEIIAPGVTTIGEVELFDFMENTLKTGQGMLVDARTPEWHQRGTIPGSVGIPFYTLQKQDSPEMDKALIMFGAKKRSDVSALTLQYESLVGDDKYKTDKWDFTNAKQLVLWCNSPQCGQSPRAIKGLLAAGYPASKLFYYRGGMQMWQLWGLNTVAPK